MNKKPKIDNIISVSNLKKTEFIELHVLVANSLSWRPESWQAYDRGSSISIGFVKVDSDTSLHDIRAALHLQLRQENLPEQYVYLRQIGRASTICSSRQERSLKAKDFSPPFYANAEICVLSADNMVFHTRMNIVSVNQNGLLPPVTPVPNRLGTHNTAPITSLERSKSPSFRSLQSLDNSSYSMFNNSELMMAEIAFLEAKRALADAHAQALRNQYMHNQSVMLENGMGSEGESEDEEAEKQRREEEQRKREEEEQERERIRKEEEEERKRLLEIEEEKRQVQKEINNERQRIKAEREERERQIEEEIQAEEDKTRALYDLKRKAAEKKRLEEEAKIAELERAAREEEEERRRKEEELRRKKEEKNKLRSWVEHLLLDEFSKAEKKAAEKIRIEEDYYEALARINNIYHVDEEIIEYDKADELEKISENLESDDNINGLEGLTSEDLINEDVDEDINKTSAKTELLPVKETDQCMKNKEKERARLAEEMFRREEQRLREAGESEDEEMDEAMKLIDDLTQTPRPWGVEKDPNKKKIVRVAKEYTKEELEEVAYLRAKIGTYRDHRTTMETKHKDLLDKLSDMEKNWDEDERLEFESKWRPKCKDEEVKTPQLYERNRQLRLELQMLYKQADTIISHAQAMKQPDDRKGMAYPSLKTNSSQYKLRRDIQTTFHNNLRINLQRLQNEVTELTKRKATAQIKYEAEKGNREGVEKEVKSLRQELINSKISSSVGGR
ncbi:trichohyalin-like isoform X3 [Bolinopsis microptera]|uniref:trichohyalin-like isoform X3 n=1 Tax=Bolinopsis microptera TaxID=2820187 RepID=UPI00307929CF